MKVFNLTDVATSRLTQLKLVDHSIAIGDKMLLPGASEEVDDETMARVRSSLEHMVSVGALACGEPPADYLVAKAKAVPPAPRKVTLPVPALEHATAEPVAAEATKSRKGG